MSNATTTDLEEVAHAANDALFYVSAILDAARLALKSGEMETWAVERLLRSASAQVEQIQLTFGPHI